MLLGLDRVAMAGGADPYHGYVSDGLVAFWDAEYGYDSANGKIKNLCGDGNDFVIDPTYGTVSGKAIYCNGNGNAATAPNALTVPDDCQCEYVVQFENPQVVSGNNTLVALYPANSYTSTSYYLGGGLFIRYGEDLYVSSKRRTGVNTNLYDLTQMSVYHDNSGGVSARATSAQEVYRDNGSMLTPTTQGGNAGPFQMPTLGRNANGWVYSVRFYNRKLTDAQRLTNWTLDNKRFSIT